MSVVSDTLSECVARLDSGHVDQRGLSAESVASRGTTVWPDRIPSQAHGVHMNNPTTSRTSRRALVLALVGTMVALAAPAAHAAPDRAVGSFETYKPAKFSGSAP